MKLLLVVVVVAAVAAAAGVSTSREDGRCGPNFPAPGGGGGVPATCEYIPPFPTCCTASEHCGWDCDDGKTASTNTFFREIIVQNLRRKFHFQQKKYVLD